MKIELKNCAKINVKRLRMTSQVTSQVTCEVTCEVILAK
jgi:hypothetical protein